MTQWYLNDDEGYLAWLAAHDDGFVLNTYAHVAAGYLVVHRASCRTINRDLAAGKAWTVQYGKACANSVDELIAWAAERTSGTPHSCGTCKPDVPESPARPGGAAHRPGGSRAVQRTSLALKLTGDPITVTIRRVDGGPTLMIEGAQWVAETFFRLDRSAVGPKSYDARVQSCPKDRFELADLRAVNGSMATRMPDKWWIELLDGVPRPWLAVIDPAWTLLDLSDEAWEEGQVTVQLRAALKEMVGDHRGLSVATKLLHLKRSELVPILDSLVVDQLGGRGKDGASLIEHVRREGRQNLGALQRIQRELATLVGADGLPIDRTLVRILDVLLWATHPASALYPILGSWRSEFHFRRPDELDKVRIPKASLRILAGYAETFAAHGPIGRWQGGEADAAGVVQMPWYEYSAEIDRFTSDMYAAKLVRSIDWMSWAGTPEAQHLITDPTAMAHASHDDLIYLLTTIIRGERFSDGEIAGAYERGTLLAIAERAQALLDDGPG